MKSSDVARVRIMLQNSEWRYWSLWKCCKSQNYVTNVRMTVLKSLDVLEKSELCYKIQNDVTESFRFVTKVRIMLQNSE
jgi:hypothetical protein